MTPPPPDAGAPDAPFAVLYEDNHLLAIGKPCGLATQPDASGDASALDLARAYLKEKYRKPGNVFLAPAHRLDRPASGALLFARTDKAAARLAAAFRDRRVDKRYDAAVAYADAGAADAWPAPDPRGDDDLPAEAWTTLDDWFLPGRGGANSRLLAAPAPGGKRAQLRLRVRATGRTDAPDGPSSIPAANGRAWLRIRLLTGLKHQIRAQLAGRGAPVIGDFRYGPRNRPARPAPYRGGRGIALHARRLGFPHPTRDAWIVVEAPWADEFPALAPRAF